MIKLGALTPFIIIVVKMGKIVDFIIGVANKRMCTIEEFTIACDKAKDVAGKDVDGFINVKDAVKIIGVVMKELRK